MTQETTQICEHEALACEAKPSSKLPKVTPRHRIVEQDAKQGGYQVFVELPGVAKGGVSLKLEKRLLTLQAQRQWELPEQASVHSRAIQDCLFELTLKLGEEIDEQALDAKLEDGLLKLNFPLATQAQAREISIH